MLKNGYWLLLACFTTPIAVADDIDSTLTPVIGANNSATTNQYLRLPANTIVSENNKTSQYNPATTDYNQQLPDTTPVKSTSYLSLPNNTAATTPGSTKTHAKTELMPNIKPTKKSSSLADNPAVDSHAQQNTTPIVAVPSINATHVENLLLSVKLNGQETQDVTLFIKTNNDLYVSKNDLQKWRLIIPDNIRPASYNGQEYYPLSLFKNAKYTLNNLNATIAFTIPPEDFQSSDISLNDSSYIKPDAPANGAFIDYDALYQNYQSDNDVSALFNAGLFSHYGSLTSGFVAQEDLNNLFHYSYSSGRNGSDTNPTDNCDNDNFVRLNTAWRKDFPAKMQTLILGDNFGTPGTWGNSVDLGGIHFGTNFSTQPYVITFPTPTFRGEATAPSAVDLYVNNARVANQNINSGPFSINAIPVVTGSGNLNVVVTDLLGRQQVITVPFYVGNTLLKKGLSDYSYELGAIRQNYGIDSNDYGRLAGTVNYRYGFTDKFTGETRLEGLGDQQTGGLGFNYQVGNFGIINLAGAASNYIPYGQGEMVNVGFQRQTYNSLNFSVNSQIASPDFMQLGIDPGLRAPKYTNQAFVGYLMGKGSLGLSYVEQDSREVDDHDHDHHCDHERRGCFGYNYTLRDYSFVSLNYSRPVFKTWSLILTAQKSLTGSHDNAVYLTLIKQIKQDTSFTTTGQSENDKLGGSVELQKNLPTDTGFGYDLQANPGVQDNYQAKLQYQNRIGNYSAAAAMQGGQMAYQGEASGSLVFMDSHPYLTRNTGDSFALVQIPGYPNIDVNLWNNPIGKTDKYGNAFVPQMNPYEKNQLTIDPNQFPVDAQINVTKLDAVPYYGTGEIVRFPVQRLAAATMTLKMPSGEIVPAGAEASVAGNDKVFPIADNGFAYVEGLAENKDNTVVVKWNDTACAVNVHYTRPKDTPVIDAGTLICMPTKN
jgi:outer membrane usher protein